VARPALQRPAPNREFLLSLALGSSSRVYEASTRFVLLNFMSNSFDFVSKHFESHLLTSAPAVHPRPVSLSQLVVFTVSSERATMLSVLVLVLQSTSLPSSSILLPKFSNWLATLLVTTRRPVSSHVIFSSLSETTRS
jgi:hypothetical protein